MPEGEEKEKGSESLSKAIMAKNSSNLPEQIDIWIQEVQWTLNCLNPMDLELFEPVKGSAGTHYNYIMKSKRKTENFESSKRKVTCYVQETPHETTSRFFNGNYQVWREWDNLVKELKEKKNCLPKYYTSKTIQQS